MKRFLNEKITHKEGAFLIDRKAFVTELCLIIHNFPLVISMQMG